MPLQFCATSALHTNFVDTDLIGPIVSYYLNLLIKFKNLTRDDAYI